NLQSVQTDRQDYRCRYALTGGPSMGCPCDLGPGESWGLSCCARALRHRASGPMTSWSMLLASRTPSCFSPGAGAAMLRAFSPSTSPGAMTGAFSLRDGTAPRCACGSQMRGISQGAAVGLKWCPLYGPGPYTVDCSQMSTQRA